MKSTTIEQFMFFIGGAYIYRFNFACEHINYYVFTYCTAGLQGLAKCPNVYCKVSGMFATDPQWDQDSVATVVQPCLDLFGMDR